jgi:hypothetical protein
MRRHPIRLAGLVAGCVALAGVLGGCGAGQQAQTVEVTATGGVGGQVESIIVRDAKVTYDGPVRGNEVYAPGDTAPLQVTIINDATTTRDDAIAADRLIAVSSPIATAGRISGEAASRTGTC